ncbi:MAG TPA: HPP family protein [Dehalococcoidales bacterium]|nr:HPP family protein [Dehalococcoidales bacterium]
MEKRRELLGVVDREFLRNPRSFIIQSLVATVVVAIILYFVEMLTHAAIVAALGASTFIVFAIPRSRTAEARRLVGGHVVGVAVGALCYFLLLNGVLRELAIEWEYVSWLVGALAVGLSIFGMTVTNTEHPPAAGTALGIIAHGWTNKTVIFILVFVLCLAIVRRLLGRHLVDLY